MKFHIQIFTVKPHYQTTSHVGPPTNEDLKYNAPFIYISILFQIDNQTISIFRQHSNGDLYMGLEMSFMLYVCSFL